MEGVLDLYVDVHTPEEPLICMDEASKQLLRDELPSEPMAPGRPQREDYHYERRGTTFLIGKLGFSQQVAIIDRAMFAARVTLGKCNPEFIQND